MFSGMSFFILKNQGRDFVVARKGTLFKSVCFTIRHQIRTPVIAVFESSISLSLLSLFRRPNWCKILRMLKVTLYILVILTGGGVVGRRSMSIKGTLK